MKPRIAIPVPNSKRTLYVAVALPQYEDAVRSREASRSSST